MGCNKNDALIFFRTMKLNTNQDDEEKFLKSFCLGCNHECERVA